MPDFVYPYKRVPGDEAELRFSLRSIEPFIGDGRVFIVGDRPGFTNDDQVKFLPFEGPAYTSVHNSQSKILHAVESIDLSDEFWLMNDDFYVLRSTAFLPDVPHLGQLLGSKECKDWRRLHFELTARTIGYPSAWEAKNFETHTPLLMRKSVLRMMMRLRLVPSGCLLRSLYCNWAEIHGVMALECDVKVSTLEEFRRLIGDTSGLSCFSASQAVGDSREFRETMGRLFPRPSRFEMEPGSGSSLPAETN